MALMLLSAMLFICLPVAANRDFMEQGRGMGRPSCEKKNFGRECRDGEAGNPGLRYYLNDELEMCIAYLYKGCGDDGNAKTTPGDCFHHCPDGSTCSPPFGGGERCRFPDYGPRYDFQLPNGSIIPFPKECPPGYECLQGMGAQCCSIGLKEIFLANTNPTCNSGKKVVTVDDNDYEGKPRETVLFGEDCADNFCPAGSTCVKLEYLAYCCQ